ncbi:hypothetical protein XENOCAPTIV_004079 [Xenoophorus captivus]|uniref:Uncharacterized protein n=1 Tax=Xenoophorus captivus TaxID=1517983 RepID=A0ABV0RH55_9TELE
MGRLRFSRDGWQLYLSATSGGFEGNPRSERRYFPSTECVSSLGFNPRRMCLENLQRKAFRTHPDQMPEPLQPTPFYVEEQQLYFELRQMKEVAGDSRIVCSNEGFALICCGEERLELKAKALSFLAHPTLNFGSNL